MTHPAASPRLPGRAPARSTLYVGRHADEIQTIYSSHIGEAEFHYRDSVGEALTALRARVYDVVVLDQREGDNALRLLLPLAASLGKAVKIVVLAKPDLVSSFLRLAGVQQVITVPVKPGQLLRATGFAVMPSQAKLTLRPARTTAPEQETGAPRGFRLSALGMTLVSNAYKRAAFVLLAVLFSAFAFYGLMIGYFLLSSGWAAPVTLSRGHELVDKVERELGDLRFNLNLVGQRQSEAQLEEDKAARANADAKILVQYAAGTVTKELEARARQATTLAGQIARLQKVRDGFARQLKSGGMASDLGKLFDKRLIDKSTFQAGTLGLLEAAQRVSAIEGEIAVLQTQAADQAAVHDMLVSLRDQLQAGEMSTITAASADLILLTKQAVDARSAFDQSKTQMESARHRREILGESKVALERQIAELEATPLGRAINGRVDVLFVPYGNEKNFKPGTRLVSCRLTILLCGRAGAVGEAIPGESTAVHPFFGKPLRGQFVEAHLDNPEAATREIIHAKRSPLFF